MSIWIDNDLFEQIKLFILSNWPEKYLKCHCPARSWRSSRYIQISTILKDMDIAPQQMLVTGGGGKSALWRQMLCDMFSVPVCSAASSESPALGAAILAAVGAGLYESVEAACAVMVKKGGAILQPVRAHTEIYHTYHNLYKKLYSSLQEDYKTLAQI